MGNPVPSDRPPAERRRVDYDRIAATYDERYRDNARSGTGHALLALVHALGAQLGRAPRVLEAGCGTGKWLADLAADTSAAATSAWVFGLDLSAGMLRQARRRPAKLSLVRGRAGQLPFAEGTFDIIYCVNAIHHFDAPRAFVSEARRLLRPGGRLAVIGMDPHGRKETWYVYRYFDGVYETDLERFPAWHEVAGWMVQEGLTNVSRRTVEHYGGTHSGRAVLEDPFLQQHATSQLALLSKEAYRAGLRRIKTALARAEARGETLSFTVDTDLAMIEGRR